MSLNEGCDLRSWIRNQKQWENMRYYLLTLGCPKNAVDSEGMEALLQQAGHRATTDPGHAQVLIVNTCGFLEAAQEESIGALRMLARRKRPDQILIAAGCLAQRNPRALVRRVPGLVRSP